MNAKERALAAIKLKDVDKIPSSYRGLDNLSIRLNKYFGFDEPENIVKNYKNLINALGADFYSSGVKISKFTTYVASYNGPLPQKPYIEDHVYYYQLGANSKLAIGGKGEYQFEYEVWVDPPLAKINDASEIRKGFLTEKLPYFDFGNFQVEYGNPDLNYQNVKNSSQDFVGIGNFSHVFMNCLALRGYEQFLTDLAFNKKLAEKIINEVCEFGLEYVRRELESFGSIAEYYGMGDDLAAQNGMIISPEDFKKYFLSYYEKLIPMVKSHDIIFSFHCCGSVHKILPMMIDAGIDVFDVVQTSAKDMSLDNIYKLYGSSICMHGGIDVQNLLVFKTPKDIKEEVKKIKHLWGNRGGIIVAPCHEALPETPIENIIALYEELNK